MGQAFLVAVLIQLWIQNFEEMRDDVMGAYEKNNVQNTVKLQKYKINFG